MAIQTIATVLAGFVLSTTALGQMPRKGLYPGFYGDNSLGEVDSFCPKVFDHIPAPQITAALLHLCDRNPLLEALGASKKATISHNMISMRDWFFVPFAPQWINTVDLLRGLYKAGASHGGKHRALRNLGKMASPLVNHHWFIDMQRFPWPNSDPYRTELWAVQVVPYSRQAYALVEVLMKRSATLSDLKRVVGILQTQRGGVVLHQLVLKFEPGSLDLRTIETLEKNFEDQNKNLQDRIFEELNPQFQFTQPNL